MGESRIIKLLMTMNKIYLLITGLLFIILVIYLLNSIKNCILIRKLKKQKGIKFYYKFLGNIYWLKREILNGRYLELKYLNSVKAKEDANLIILLERDSKDNTGIIRVYKEDCKILIKELKLNGEELKEILEKFPDTVIENNETIEN